MIKKAILLEEEAFHIISFLSTGYWLGEESLTYYDDSGRMAKGDLLGRLIVIDDCIPLILEEFYTGLYKISYKVIDVEKRNFNRKMDTSGLKNWIGWTTKHKMYIVC